MGMGFVRPGALDKLGFGGSDDRGVRTGNFFHAGWGGGDGLMADGDVHLDRRDMKRGCVDRVWRVKVGV